jgi:hypothetical protein
MIDWRCSNCWFCGSAMIRFYANPTIFVCSSDCCNRLARGINSSLDTSWFKLYFEDRGVVLMCDRNGWRLLGQQSSKIYEDRPVLLEGIDIEADWNLTDMKVLEEQIDYYLLFM